MLPQQAFDRTERPIGRVIGMDVDAKGDPKGYVILLEGEAAETVLGATRGLLVVPAHEVTVRDAPQAGPPDSDVAESVLILKSNMERLRRGWAAGKGPAAEDEDPARW